MMNRPILYFALLMMLTLSGCKQDDVLVPSITSFTPKEGSVGTSVTITGTNFSTSLSKNTVKISNTILPIDQATATELIVTIPAGTESGEISVIVNGQKTISSESFIILSVPFLTSVTPPSGKAGDIIKVTGKSFITGSVNNLTLAGRSVPVTVLSNSELNFTVPSNGKSGDIIVTTSLGVSNAMPFRQQMIIESFSPSSGPIGTKVKIKGSGLSASYFPFFSGLPGIAISDSGTELIVAPSKGTSSGPISIAENLTGVPSVTTTNNFTLTSVQPTLIPPYPGVAKVVGMGFAIGTDLYFGLGQDVAISSFYDFWKYSTTNNN